MAPRASLLKRGMRSGKLIKPHPGAVVGDVDALLAAGAGGDEGAVHVEDGLVEELGRLLFPDLDPGPIEDVLEDLDVLRGEAAAEVAGSGRVGDAVGPQGVEEDDVVASQLDVVEAGAVAQGVVGEVQDVVRLVVREVELEQVEPLVDGLGESELADQQLDGADAAAGDAAGLGGGLVVDVGGGEDRLGRRCGDRPVEPAADFRLPAAWWRCGIGLTRSLLGGAAVGSVRVDPICRKRREIVDISPAARTRPATSSSRMGHGGETPRRMRRVTWPWP